MFTAFGRFLLRSLCLPTLRIQNSTYSTLTLQVFEQTIGGRRNSDANINVKLNTFGTRNVTTVRHFPILSNRTTVEPFGYPTTARDATEWIGGGLEKTVLGQTAWRHNRGVPINRILISGINAAGFATSANVFAVRGLISPFV